MFFSCADQNGLNSDFARTSPDWFWAPSIMLSITVIRLSALVSWKVRTMPDLATLEAEVRSSVAPSKLQCAPWPADVGRSNPVIRLKNVVLPAPFGPISAVMMPRWTSRWLTSTAVMPPNCRTMWSTSRIESGLPAPGSASTPDMSSRRTAGSASDAVVVVSDIEPQLPLVTQDALGSEDHQQHQRDADHDEGELAGLLAVHDVDVLVGGQVGVGRSDDEDAADVEDQRPEHRPPQRRRATEQQGGVAEERDR